MANNDDTPATKVDIKLMMEQIGTFIDRTEKAMANLEDRIGVRMVEQEDRLTRHFSVVAEDLVHDFKGAFHDKLEQHEDRILRLEHLAGLTTA